MLWLEELGQGRSVLSGIIKSRSAGQLLKTEFAGGLGGREMAVR